MSRRTSSLSTLTTVPFTMSPSSKLTMVPAMASSSDMPSRSSDTTCFGMYSPSSSRVSGAAVDCCSACSDITVAFFPDCSRPLLEGLQRALRGYTLGKQQKLWVLDVRRGARVAPWGDRPQSQHTQSSALRELTELARRVAGGPEIEGRVVAVTVLHRRVLAVHAGVRVEVVAVLQVADEEVRREGREREPAARTQGGGHLVQDVDVVGRGWIRGEPEAALAERDDGVEPRPEWQTPGVAPREHCTRGRGFGG